MFKKQEATKTASREDTQTHRKRRQPSQEEKDQIAASKNLWKLAEGNPAIEAAAILRYTGVDISKINLLTPKIQEEQAKLTLDALVKLHETPVHMTYLVRRIADNIAINIAKEPDFALLYDTLLKFLKLIPQGNCPPEGDIPQPLSNEAGIKSATAEVTPVSSEPTWVETPWGRAKEFKG